MVLDDFRSEHTPGVSVAAWEAVLNRGLRPICLSTQKLYGTWGDPEPLQEKLLAMIQERDDFGLSVQMAAGHRLIRTRSQGMKPPPFPHSRHYVEPVPEPVPAPGGRRAGPGPVRGPRCRAVAYPAYRARPAAAGRHAGRAAEPRGQARGARLGASRGTAWKRGCVGCGPAWLVRAVHAAPLSGRRPLTGPA